MIEFLVGAMILGAAIGVVCCMVYIISIWTMDSATPILDALVIFLWIVLIGMLVATAVFMFIVTASAIGEAVVNSA